MELVQSDDLVNTVDTDDLVLWHQGINSYTAEYTPVYEYITVYGLWKSESEQTFALFVTDWFIFS